VNNTKNELLEPDCDCMSKLGFKTCIKCIDYQREYVYAIKERERRWAKAIRDSNK